MILAACFINDLGTVLALGLIFANFTCGCWCSSSSMRDALVHAQVDRVDRRAHARTRVSEPEIKFIFFVLFFLGGLASTAKSEAVLPAYLVGLVVAGVFLRDKTLVHRMRSIAFAMFTPFYFIRAGTFISSPALVRAGVIVLLLAEDGAKVVGVRPGRDAFMLPRRERAYTTLLMATGLTFGSISALFGLTTTSSTGPSTPSLSPSSSCPPSCRP